MLGIIVNEWSVLDVPSVDHEFCAKSGWKNLLFLDQFLPITKRVIKLFLFLIQITKV